MKLRIFCYDCGMKYDYKPFEVEKLVFYKDRNFYQPVTLENLAIFNALPGKMFAYPNYPEFGLSKLGQFEVPLYSNGQENVKRIEIIN